MMNPLSDPPSFLKECFSLQVLNIYLICLKSVRPEPVLNFNPNYLIRVINLLMSIISGNIINNNFSGVNKTAHNICNASFFAPCG
jgi:hypothetical protein